MPQYSETLWTLCCAQGGRVMCAHDPADYSDMTKSTWVVCAGRSLKICTRASVRTTPL